MDVIISEIWRQLFLSIHQKYFKDEKTTKKSLVTLVLIWIGAKMFNKIFDFDSLN